MKYDKVERVDTSKTYIPTLFISAIILFIYFFFFFGFFFIIHVYLLLPPARYSIQQHHSLIAGQTYVCIKPRHALTELVIFFFF